MSDEKLIALWNQKYIYKKDIKDIDYSFLPDSIKSGIPRQIVWHLINKIYDVVLCECGKTVKWAKNLNYYRTYCSNECAINSNSVKEKRKKTNLEKYGSENPFGNKEIQKRIKNTNIEKYGVEHALQNDEFLNKAKNTMITKYGVDNALHSTEIKEKIKQTNTKKYGFETPLQNPEIKEKIKNTNLEKYGVEYPQQNESIKEKTKNTNIEKYGVEYPQQNESIKEKTKNTNIEKYGVEYPLLNPEIQEKIKQTNYERYGTENPFGNKEIQEKIKQTNYERYGTENSSNNKDIQEKRKQTNLERYGTENPFGNKEIQEKIKQTNLERYGTENPFGNKEIQEKIKQTNLEKYGVEYPLLNPEIQEKIKQTNLEKYGVDNPFGNDEIKEKIKQTNLERYGTPFPRQTHLSQDTIEILNNKEKFSKFIRGKSSYEIYDDLGIHQTCFHNSVKKYDVHDLYKRRGPSYLEVEMEKFLDELDIKYEKNNRTILKGKELDFHIPEYDIAIEMNGIYWHSDKHILDKNYHFNKWKMCFDSGIHLISIFEDDWLNQNKKIKNMLKYYFDINKESIYEKLFYINQIESPVAKEFLDKYHLNGFVEGNHFGAFDKENKLLAVMTINHKTDNVFVLKRFVNKKYDYTKLFSELFNYAKNDLNINEIISYSDNTFFRGNEYVNNGFKLNRIQTPEYSYVIKNKRVKKQNIIKNKPKIVFYNFTNHIKNDIMEHTIMNLIDIPKIYDCGKCEWIWKKI